MGKKQINSSKLEWKVNTPQLLKEILVNNETSALRIPIAVFGRILAEVSDRALQLNDPKLNALMCRLALYEESDPYSKEYNEELTMQTIDAVK